MEVWLRARLTITRVSSVNQATPRTLWLHPERTKIPLFSPNCKRCICFLADWAPVSGNKIVSERVVPSRAAPRSIARQQLHGLQEIVESTLDLTCLLVACSLFMEFLLETKNDALPDVARDPRWWIL
eukprot:scaffold99802_cov75-Phaeocystis_antarctica.AAC.2